MSVDSTVKADAVEIVKLLTERNRALRDQISQQTVPLEEFAETIIIMWCGFNGIDTSKMPK